MVALDTTGQRMLIDTDDVEAVGDPLKRAQAADDQLAEAERLVEYLKELRAEGMRAYARQVGGFKAAADLNMNRASMYRAIRRGISSGAAERDEMYWHMQAKALEARLRKQGMTADEIRNWWYAPVRPELGQRTAIEAWRIGMYEAVIALVP